MDRILRVPMLQGDIGTVIIVANIEASQLEALLAPIAGTVRSDLARVVQD